MPPTPHPPASSTPTPGGSGNAGAPAAGSLPSRLTPTRWPPTWSNAPPPAPRWPASTWPAPPSATCTASTDCPTPPKTSSSGRSASGCAAPTAPPPRRLARPLTVSEIRQIIDALDRSTPIGARDAAIILLGYASAMRGSELVALELRDLELKPGGLLITIRRSKTDQEHHGQVVAVAHGCHAVTDPVAALTTWLRIRGHQPGPLFSRIWYSRVSDQVLGNHVVARMLRDRAVAAGIDGTRITAHSLRAGHATTAALAGVPLIRIAAQTRHKDLNVLERV